MSLKLKIHRISKSSRFHLYVPKRFHPNIIISNFWKLSFSFGCVWPEINIWKRLSSWAILHENLNEELRVQSIGCFTKTNIFKEILKSLKASHCNRPIVCIEHILKEQCPTKLLRLFFGVFLGYQNRYRHAFFSTVLWKNGF